MSYYNHNKQNYIKLSKLYDYITDTLDDILTNFQAFKIELYDKHIINNLCEITNRIIKSLCHIDTKPFKLDYFINFNNQEKNLISINQSSSLALRMSLFNNKIKYLLINLISL